MAAFLAWTLAGVRISLFSLIHRQVMLDLFRPLTDERVVTRWFAWCQAAFLFGAAAGGWVFVALGDRIGRTRAMGLSMSWQAAFTIASYTADSVNVLMALRFLAC